MLRAFLSRLVPSDLLAYVPGQKLVAGAVLLVLADVFGVKGQVFNVPFVDVDVNVEAFAALVGFYLWTTNERFSFKSLLERLKAIVSNPKAAV